MARDRNAETEVARRAKFFETEWQADELRIADLTKERDELAAQLEKTLEAIRMPEDEPPVLAAETIYLRHAMKVCEEKIKALQSEHDRKADEAKELRGALKLCHERGERCKLDRDNLANELADEKRELDRMAEGVVADRTIADGLRSENTKLTSELVDLRFELARKPRCECDQCERPEHRRHKHREKRR